MDIYSLLLPINVLFYQKKQVKKHLLYRFRFK